MVYKGRAWRGGLQRISQHIGVVEPAPEGGDGAEGKHEAAEEGEHASIDRLKNRCRVRVGGADREEVAKGEVGPIDEHEAEREQRERHPAVLAKPCATATATSQWWA